MTKKNYIKLAAAFRDARGKLLSKRYPPEEVSAIMESFIVPLCDCLMNDNKAFDPDKFYDAVYSNKG